MQPKTPKLLEDIRDGAAFIAEVTAGKSVDDYRADRLLRQAVERNFEIIGEAVSRLAKLDPDVAARIGNYPQIISFRNVLIHGYDLIDDAQVWRVITNDLPRLEEEVSELLRDNKRPAKVPSCILIRRRTLTPLASMLVSLAFFSASYIALVRSGNRPFGIWLWIALAASIGACIGSLWRRPVVPAIKGAGLGALLAGAVILFSASFARWQE
jgi:uncharacterized protein with HEPN domain